MQRRLQFIKSKTHSIDDRSFAVYCHYHSGVPTPISCPGVLSGLALPSVHQPLN